MPGPMHWFRKHQKVMLIVVGTSMALFLVGSGITENLRQGGGRSSDPALKAVVVTWDGNELTRGELDRLRDGRLRAFTFQQGLYELVIDLKKVPNRSLALNISDNSDTAILARELMAREAERMGIVVSDEAITDYLFEFSGNNTMEGDYLDILQTNLSGMPIESLYTILRRELLAEEIRKMSISGLATMSPIEAFRYHQQMTRRIRAEVLPVAVEDFIGSVGDPTESQIRELYEEYKDEPSFAGSPGFLLGRRVQLEIVEGRFADFLAKAEENITDEQVANYYQENRDNFRYPVPDPEPTIDLPFELPGPPSPYYQEETSSPSVADPDDTEDTEDTTPTAEPPVEAPPAEESSGETTEEADPIEEEALPTPTDQGRAHLPRTPVRLAAFQVEEETEDGSAEEEAIDEEPSLPGPPSPYYGEAPVFKPFDEVADEIRTTLATPDARTALDEAMSAAEKVMEKFSEDYGDWAHKVEFEESKEKEPTSPNLGTLCEEHGLIFVKTSLVDVSQLQENYSAGKSVNYVFGQGWVNIAYFAFAEDRNKYSPFSTDSADENRLGLSYVSWKIKEKGIETPDLETAREAVVRAWKEQEALEKARERANEYAKQVRDSESTLADIFFNIESLEPVETNGFTWFMDFAQPDALGRPGRPQLGPSRVDNVVRPGEEFMESVFALQLGEIGTAVNDDHSIVYVVRIISDPFTLQQQRQKFLNEGLADPVWILRNTAASKVWNDWYQQLEESHDVDWVSPPTPGDSLRN